MKQRSIRFIRQFLLALAFCAMFSTSAMAQPKEQRGKGMYVGDLTGELSYVLFNSRSGNSALIFGGVIIAGENFSGGEKGWTLNGGGADFGFDATEPEGQIQIDSESEFGHVLSVRGEYDGNGVRGTWTLVYDPTNLCIDRDCTTKTGSFNIPVTVEAGGGGGSGGDTPAPVGCGAAAMASLAMILLGLGGFKVNRWCATE